MSFSFGGKTAFGSTPAFGAQNTAANLSFRTPTAPTSQPSLFGTSATQPNTGLNFGTPASSAPAPTGLFGAPASSAPATGFSFNTAPATAGPQFGTGSGGFGSTTATTSAGTGLNFGTPQNTGLSFGATAASTPPKLGLSFGAPTATPASTGLTLGATPAATNTGFSLGATSTAPTLGLSFGATASTAAPTLNFGAAPVASTGLSFGLGNTTTTTSSTGLGFGFGNQQPAASTAQPVGLGGIASSTPSQNASATKAEQAPKDQHLPNEIQQTVDNFKNFVKLQKSYSSDVARCSVKEFKKVEADIDSINNLLNDVEKQLHMNKNTAEKLKYDTARGLKQVEIAQRTYDTPMGLQYENNAPLNFFMELVDNFEREMQNMKLQIENTDKYFKNIGNPTPLSSQELSMGMRRIHEAFVALAGRLQSVHSQVETQKEEYLNFRRHMLNDPTNIFEKNNKEAEVLNFALNNFKLQTQHVVTGPTPFSAVSHATVVQATPQSNIPPAYQPSNNTFGGFGTSNPLSLSTGNTSSLFGNTSAFGQPAQQSSFQLQKPPSGSKRGKQ